MKIKHYVLLVLILLGLFSAPDRKDILAYGECTQYGAMSYYDSLTDSCRCMSGYVFGDLAGSTYCVSGDVVCHDKYGYNSRYDSLDGACECDYGYVWGENIFGESECVSPNQICEDSLGYNSRYNSLKDTCECSYGYVIDGGECVYGDQVCRSEHGMYSSYDSLENACVCDDGYTLDDYGECVEKQNNVYFKLVELDTYNRLAVIKSEYDYSNYLVSYGLGCLDATFERYVGKQIVVNLGTDFYVDTWDKIVLFNNSQVCDIRSVEKVTSDFTLQTDEEDSLTYSYQEISDLPAQIEQNSYAPDEVEDDPDLLLENASDSTESVDEPIDFVTPSASMPWYKRIWSKISSFFSE